MTGYILTDRRTIRIALQDAIDYNTDIMEAYNFNDDESAVKTARKDIKAFRRVLKRYYGDDQTKSVREMLDRELDQMETVSVTTIANGKRASNAG